MSGQNFVFDRRIPLAFVFTLLLQAGTAVWWASTKEAQDHFRDQRLRELETRITHSSDYEAQVLDRLARLETRAEEHGAVLRRLDAYLLGNKK